MSHLVMISDTYGESRDVPPLPGAFTVHEPASIQYIYSQRPNPQYQRNRHVVSTPLVTRNTLESLLCDNQQSTPVTVGTEESYLEATVQVRPQIAAKDVPRENRFTVVEGKQGLFSCFRNRQKSPVRLQPLRKGERTPPRRSQQRQSTDERAHVSNRNVHQPCTPMHVNPRQQVLRNLIPPPPLSSNSTVSSATESLEDSRASPPEIQARKSILEVFPFADEDRLKCLLLQGKSVRTIVSIFAEESTHEETAAASAGGSTNARREETGTLEPGVRQILEVFPDVSVDCIRYRLGSESVDQVLLELADESMGHA